MAEKRRHDEVHGDHGDEEDDIEPDSVKRARVEGEFASIHIPGLPQIITVENMEELVVKIPDIVMIIVMHLGLQTIEDLCALSKAFRNFCEARLDLRFWTALYLADHVVPYTEITLRGTDKHEVAKKMVRKKIKNYTREQMKKEYASGLLHPNTVQSHVVSKGIKLAAWIELIESDDSKKKYNSQWEYLRMVGAMVTSGLFSEVSYAHTTTVKDQGVLGLSTPESIVPYLPMRQPFYDRTKSRLIVGKKVNARIIIAVVLKEKDSLLWVDKEDLGIIMDRFVNMTISEKSGPDTNSPLAYVYEPITGFLKVKTIQTSGSGLWRHFKMSRYLVNFDLRRAFFNGGIAAFKRYNIVTKAFDISARGTFHSQSFPNGQMGLVRDKQGLIAVYNREKDSFHCEHWHKEEEYMDWLSTCITYGPDLCPTCSKVNEKVE